MFFFFLSFLLISGGSVCKLDIHTPEREREKNGEVVGDKGCSSTFPIAPVCLCCHSHKSQGFSLALYVHASTAMNIFDYGVLRFNGNPNRTCFFQIIDLYVMFAVFTAVIQVRHTSSWFFRRRILQIFDCYLCGSGSRTRLTSSNPYCSILNNKTWPNLIRSGLVAV